MSTLPNRSSPCGGTPAPTPLITPTEGGIASRVLAKGSGGNVTIFAFDAGQELSEHQTSLDALVLVLDGAFDLTIAGTVVRATPGILVRMPANGRARGPCA